MKTNPTGEGIIIYDLPNETWIEEALVSSFDCYLKTVELINNTFTLNLDEKLKEFIQEFMKSRKK